MEQHARGAPQHLAGRELTCLGVGLLAGLAYALLVRPWQLRWGARLEEARGALRGDDLVPAPDYVTTRAITAEAPPQAVWPWLVQLGQARGGFYTYDALERLFGAAIQNADRLLPEFQHLRVGDTVRLSPAGGPRVVVVDPEKALVLHDRMDVRTGRSVPREALAELLVDWSWAFALQPVGEQATRFVVRTRARLTPRLPLLPFTLLLLEPAHFIMERGMLLGIKRRAESSAARDVRSPNGT
jgi:hypothetical protein